MARPARDIALQALLDRQSQPSRHLDRLLNEGGLSAPEAALATELTLGVTRHQRTLDALIVACSDRPDREMPAALRQILRLGAYQLAMLQRVPDFAAVNEAVRQCRRRQPHATGFVNALLRNLARGLGEVQGQDPSEPDARPNPPPLEPDVLPLTLGSFRRVDRPVFPSITERPAEYIAQAASLPDELARRWLSRCPSPREAFELAMQCNARPRVVLRVEPGLSVPEALAELAASGVQAVPHENGRSVVLSSHVNVADLVLVQQGRLTPQDATASAPAEAMDVQPGMSVLDFCAAPGTKTTQIARRMDGQGHVLAVDVNEEKLALVRQAARRCGVTIVQTCLAEQMNTVPMESFDRVLVDAPCSNTGVLARRVEARWRFSTEALRRLASDQRQILAFAAMFAAPGGRIVYSTCSIEPEENEQVVRAFLKTSRRWRLLREQLTLPAGQVPPSRYRDGGYYAVLGPV